MADLNKVLDYNLIGKIPTITPAAQRKIDRHVIVDKDVWGDSFSKDFISEAKTYYAGRQGTKCAYCRTTISPKGSGNAVEHITARIHKPNWMFVLHNLVVSCDNCNSSKGIKDMLINNHNTFGHLPANCPNDSISYHLFNPHHDKWSDHFEIEDSYFLKPKANTKGAFTYKELGMNRDLLIINFMIQQQVRLPNSIRAINMRIKNEKDKSKLVVLKEALAYFDDLLNNE